MAPGGTMHPARTCSTVPLRIGRHARPGDSSVEAAVVLLERRVDREGRGDHHAGQRLREPVVHQDDVAVGGGEQRPRQPLPLLRDAGDLDPGRIGDREVPRPPVLRLDGADRPAVGHQVEADPPEDVGLHDLTDRGAVGALHHHPRLHELGRPGQHQDRTRGIPDLQPVGEELVELRDEPEGLLPRPLAALHDGADLPALPVEDRVLVGELDELGPLAHDQDRLLVERGTPAAPRCGRRRLGGRGVLDVVGPALPVPPPHSAAPGRIGIPGGRRRGLRHGRQANARGQGGRRSQACHTPPMADLTGVEARVLDAVDESWVVDRLTRLVAVPSVGGTQAESEVQHLLGGWLDELGCDVDTWPIDLAEAAAAADSPGQEVERTEAWGVVGTLPAAESGPPALVFSGHTDVVPPGDRSLWECDPFLPRIVGGDLHGRGACDMKARVTASLAALAAVRAAGARLVRPVALHGVIGEEDGGLGAWATLRRGHRGDVCVIPEPTAGAVVTACAGALTFRLEISGRAAHAAYRDEGVSALELFEELHADLRELEAERQKDADPRFGESHYPYGLSIGRLSTGDWSSSVPDRLVAEGRYGVIVGEPVEAARRGFEDRGTAFLAAHPWLAEHPVRVVWTGGSFTSGSLPPGHPLLGTVRAAVADAGGGELPE